MIEAQKMGVPCIASAAVPDAAKISNLIKKIDLALPIDVWIKEIEDFSVESIQYHGLEEWDIRQVVKKMEKLYEE